MNADTFSVSDLAAQLNQWCKQHGVEPLHNGAGTEVTVRNIRYYQSLGLVDRPLSADGRGFAEKHRLQLIAIRLLQAKGLPLARIQSLVSGRNEEELREVESRGVSELEAAPAFPQPVRAAEWKVTVSLSNSLLRSGSKSRKYSVLNRNRPEAANLTAARDWTAFDRKQIRPENCC
jgi:DNA-binding transcriptional MerR regulator